MTHSLDEVKDALRADLATEFASRGLEEKADAVLSQALAGKSMQEAAKASSSDAVKAESTGLVSAEELAQKLGIREADIVALSKSIPEIFSSSLTTMGGLIAMMFM